MIQREELEQALVQYFDKIHFDKKASARIEEQLISKRKMLNGNIAGILSQIDDISKISDEELYWFAEASELEFNFQQYFSPKEIEMYSHSKSQHSVSIFPLTFENVIQVNERQFVTTITAQKLYNLYQHQVIFYNLNTQRNPKIIIADGKEKLVININKRSVASITSLLKRGLFIPNALTFNIREERNGAEYEYDESNAELTIFNNGFDIIDGYHRYLALTRVINENPDFDITFVLNIMNFTEEEAKRFVAQEDKRNKINASYSKSLDTTRFETILVSRLNGDSTSYLYGQIQSIGDKKIDAGKMIDIVGQVLKPRSNSDVVYMEQKLCLFLNQLFDLNSGYLNEFSDSDMRVTVCCFSQAKEVSETDTILQQLRKPENKTIIRNTSAILKYIQGKE